MIADYLSLAFASISHRKLRSWLTLIGILIGIMAVVALISLSVGMQNAITSEFKSIGANRVVVAPGGMFMGPGNTGYTTATFGDAELKAVQELRGIDAIVPVLARTMRIEYKGQAGNVPVMGTPTDSETLKITEKLDVYKVKEGRNLRAADKYTVDITHNLAYDTFDKDIRVGSKITLDGYEFEVVGIKPEGIHNSMSGNWIPLGTAREIFNEPNEISNMFVLTKEGFTPKDVAEDIKKKLRKVRNVEEGYEDFYVQTAEQVIDTFTQVLSAVRAVLVGIAAISLIVGGVGIMNTMYTSVVERTKEIGIMKSVGATNESIATLFVIESGLLGLFGGTIGVIFGACIGFIAEFLAKQIGGVTLKPELSLALILGALSFSFMIGTIAGLLPAMKAARLRPVEALQR